MKGDRHSRVVSWLKVLFPLIALALLLVGIAVRLGVGDMLS